MVSSRSIAQQLKIVSKKKLNPVAESLIQKAARYLSATPIKNMTDQMSKLTLFLNW